MPWFKIDDAFHCHPKILAAGNAATGLFVRLGSYCSQQLTDGAIPAMIAKSYGTTGQINTLVTLGLLDATDEGYLIPDFLDFNPSAEKVRHDRAEAAERQRKHREARDASRSESHRDNAVTSRVVTPTPTRPDPTRPASSSRSTDSSPRTHAADPVDNSSRRGTRGGPTAISDLINPTRARGTK